MLFNMIYKYNTSSKLRYEKMPLLDPLRVTVNAQGNSIFIKGNAVMNSKFQFN